MQDIPELNATNRKLLKEGTLLVNKVKRAVFLFNDALLYCKVKKDNKLKFKGFIVLSTSTMNFSIDSLRLLMTH
jgi:hypothetical protein